MEEIQLMGYVLDKTLAKMDMNSRRENVYKKRMMTMTTMKDTKS
jgi:hypothetical protein